MQTEPKQAASPAEARRRFLAQCGRFAIVTPPAVTLILAETERSYATATSGGNGIKVHGNNGFGNGGDDPPPGNSANNSSPNANEKKEDENR